MFWNSWSACRNGGRIDRNPQYARQQWWSRYFTYPNGLAPAVRILSILYALVRCYATALAVEDGRTVEPRDVLSAIWQIEREFVHSDLTMAFWRQILENPLASKPWFVPLLVL